MAATSAQGSLIKIGTAAPGTYNTIPGTTKFQVPNAQREFNEATSHDSAGGFKEWLPGLLDGGDIAFDFLFDPVNAIHQQVITNANSNPGTLMWFQAILPTASFNTWLWKGYVSLEGPMLEKGKLMTAILKCRVTGAVTYPVA